MGKRYGLIAGSGEYPRYLLEEGMRRGDCFVVAGIKGECDADFRKEADDFRLFELHELPALIGFFKSHNIDEIFLSGKVEHRIIFQDETPAPGVRLFLDALKDSTPKSLLQGLIGLLEKQGLTILDPADLIQDAFCSEGLLSGPIPTKKIENDMDFGWETARMLADGEAGQTIVVKNRAVVAVEGMEGTDETIRRGAALAGERAVVIKAARSRQDNRIDLPSVGLTTIEILIDARCAALCIEADRVAFFQKEQALRLAEKSFLTIIARKSSG